MPTQVERRLLVRPLPPEMLSETMLLPGGGTDIDLGDHIEETYLDDWKVVSHTFTLTPDSPEVAGIVTVLVERPRV